MSLTHRIDLFAGLAGTMLLAVGCAGADPETADEAEIKAGQALEVEATSDLALAEASGLGFSSDGRILAVGDSDADVVGFRLDSKGRATDQRHADLSHLPVNGEAGSQWEAVATDGTGHVFVLSENPSVVYVLDPSMQKLVHTITLDVLPGSETFKTWSKNTNSRGEGMVLLESGHILLAIEKDPPALAEFGPEGADPGGYQPGASVSTTAFSLPKGSASTMVLLHTWAIKSGDRGVLKDISEIAVGPDQRLYLMTQEGRAIVRIERVLDPDELMVDIKSVHPLPSSLRAPEGLVILHDRRVLVADDTRDPEANLSLLSALPAIAE